jgi:hypothetical protein
MGNPSLYLAHVDTGPASRAAAKAARAERLARAGIRPTPGRRLVSLGVTSAMLEGLLNTDTPRVERRELLYDADDPRAVFVRDGGALVPLTNRVVEGDKVIARGELPRRIRPSGNHAAGRPDVVTPVGGDDEDDRGN